MASDRCSAWQSESHSAPTVLAAVFKWLGPHDLARAASVCRVWYGTATMPAPWRRSLRLPGDAARALVRHRVEGGAGWWRAEAIRAAAGWRRERSLRAEGAMIHHAALDARACLIATADDDAIVMVWAIENDKWALLDTAKMGVFGWASAARVEWAPDGPQLLAAGPLALAMRWETAALVVRDRRLYVTSRITGSAPGATWAGHGALLAPELVAGSGLAVTSLRLYAAEQRLHSEMAAVTEAPLLRVYNEAATHLSHLMIMEPPTWSEDNGHDDEVIMNGEKWPGAAYWAATAAERGLAGSGCMLLAAGGVRGGPRGEQRALLGWPLSSRSTLQTSESAPLPPTELRRRHANRAQLLLMANDQDDVPPDEETLRALCTTPRWVRRLASRVLGLAPAPGAGCVWALTADSYLTCVSLPTLQILCRLRATAADTAPLPPLYLQPSVSRSFVTSPVNGGVAVRLAGSGAVGVGVAMAGAVAALVARGQLLVVAGAELQCWCSAAGDIYNPSDNEFLGNNDNCYK